MDRGTIDCRFEVKAAADDAAPMSFAGYGAVFGNVDAYGDVIEQGAFDRTVRDIKKTGIWPAMLAQHGGYGMSADDMEPIGVWTKFKEDDKGLWVEGTLADTPRGRTTYALLKMQPRPAIDGLSIGYIAKSFEVGTKPKEPRRTLKEIELLEVSLVTFPANTLARVASVKAADLTTERAFERLLTRDAGLSRSDAIWIINHGVKSWLAKRDAGGEASELAALAEMVKRNTAKLQPST